MFLDYLLFIVYWFPGRKYFYVINHRCSLYYQMHLFGYWWIDWTNLLSLLFPFHDVSILIFKWSKIKVCIQRLLIRVDFPYFLFQSTFLWDFSLDISVIGCWLFFALIISALIDLDICPWMWLKFFCGKYTNQT